ncbi:uncharacterized protein LOC128233562 isoform X2 [Mya arenaria]|uniref:uncharacterized protein LOC128233562 isoform X2 n=1 Tax=Mya arenaria TaxID=6604 RepID=UPI0022E2C588|nr:uncharacterized protein LOC128233562 isoform X2 [Mya arenaria]
MFKMEVYLKSICFILLTAKVICNIVYEGDPAVLVCTIASDAYPSWNGPPHISGRSTLYNYEASQHFNPALIDNKLLRMKWAENKRDLNFTSVLQEDEGNYSCSAASIGTMSITVTVEGRIFSRPGKQPILIYNHNYTNDGSVVLVSPSGNIFQAICLDGNCYNDQYLNCSLSSSGNISNGSFHIILDTFWHGQEGEYQFESAGSVLKTITVFLLETPTISISPTKDAYIEGNTLTFMCASNSTTLPVSHNLLLNYTWIINNNIYSNSSRLSHSQRGEYLTIQGISGADALLEIKCSAVENIAQGFTSNKSNAAQFNVIYGPNASVISENTPYVVTEGEEMDQIICTSVCWPGCTQFWKNDTDNTTTAMSGIISLGTIARYHSGNYTCVSRNIRPEYLKESSSTISFVVQYSPDVLIKTVNTTSTESGIFLRCSAKGVPNKYIYYDWVQHWPGYGVVAIHPPNGDSFKLDSVSYQYSGIWYCSVSNGIVDYVTQNIKKNASVEILIKDAPVLVKPNLPSGSIHNIKVAESDREILIEVHIYSNSGPVRIHVYPLENGIRTKDEFEVIGLYQAEILLPVFEHYISTQGTIANVSLEVNGNAKSSRYVMMIKNDFKETLLTVELTKDLPTEQTYLVGAIVGSVVGGAALCLLVVLLVNCMRSTRISKNLAQATGSQSKETDRHSSELAAKYEMDNIQEYLDIQESIDQGSDLAAHYETLETNKTSHGNAYEDLIQKQET